MTKTIDKLYDWRGFQTDTPPDSAGRKFLDALVDTYGIAPCDLDIGFEIEDGRPVPHEAGNKVIRLAEGIDFTFKDGWVRGYVRFAKAFEYVPLPWLIHSENATDDQRLDVVRKNAKTLSATVADRLNDRALEMEKEILLSER